MNTILGDPLRFFFFFNDTATTEIYTLSLHDALPISGHDVRRLVLTYTGSWEIPLWLRDRKSTRLNSSHANISYAVFCLQKKKIRKTKYMHKIRYILINRSKLHIELH